METAIAKKDSIDLTTGEVQEEKKVVTFKNEFDVSGMLLSAGTIELSQEQKGILYAPVNPEDVEIRSDGLIYCPWMEYASRLRDTFGLEWALIPQGMPTFKNNFIYWAFWLVIKGHLCGYAIGEQRYFPESKGGKDFMTYGDACEGAKSNALMRLCKGIGISLELWKPSFVREWKSTHAVSYKGADGKTYWKRKTNGHIPDEKPETGDKQEPTPTEHPAPAESNLKDSDTSFTITPNQNKRLWAITKGKEPDDAKARAFIDWLKEQSDLYTVEVEGKKQLTRQAVSRLFNENDKVFNQKWEEFNQA